MVTRRRLMAVSGAAVVVSPLVLLQDSGEARRKTRHPKVFNRTFANTQSLEILSYTTRSSTILVSGFKGKWIRSVRLTLHNLSHELLGPVSFLLVAPDGRNIIPLSDVVVNNVSNVTLTFDDYLGDELPAGPSLVSGTYRPCNLNNDTGSDFNPMEVPPVSGKTALSTFRGINPNGEWTLYVYNANSSNPGLLAGGWSLNIWAYARRIDR